MAGDSTDADGEDAGPAKAPWWTWGFVVAILPAFLGLVTHWFTATPPPRVDGDIETYSAWTIPYIGMIGPFFMMWVGGQWYGARRGWWRPPAPGDWRGFSRGLSYSFVAVQGAGPSRSSSPAPTVMFPFRTGANMSIAEGVAVLVLMGINRACYAPKYTIVNLTSAGVRQGDLNVHPAFGFWCVLVAAGLFIVTGAVGAVVPVEQP